MSGCGCTTGCLSIAITVTSVGKPSLVFSQSPRKSHPPKRCLASTPPSAELQMVLLQIPTNNGFNHGFKVVRTDFATSHILPSIHQRSVEGANRFEAPSAPTLPRTSQIKPKPWRRPRRSTWRRRPGTRPPAMQGIIVSMFGASDSDTKRFRLHMAECTWPIRPCWRY